MAAYAASSPAATLRASAASLASSGAASGLAPGGCRAVAVIGLGSTDARAAGVSPACPGPAAMEAVSARAGARRGRRRRGAGRRRGARGRRLRRAAGTRGLERRADLGLREAEGLGQRGD